ncbi:hypothetical protein JX265_006442 [Neoarthrinium moseri]|uniref:Uncharacterized protein n=1 Tax=Neoarthrinium moseri TaxID=1658444 RepID=A0A9P9WLY9_9PEZI|nr:uncharacterized protein JN550_013329 [Neoarthrinium moseri]KAI1857303.1 hypothetical protein JN550_013329 [Neoarthrinium moseri]KAI1870272.1 hypothetical protein JX265_006442 [Neoarthrinium moseri]
MPLAVTCAALDEAKVVEPPGSHPDSVCRGTGYELVPLPNQPPSPSLDPFLPTSSGGLASSVLGAIKYRRTRVGSHLPQAADRAAAIMNTPYKRYLGNNNKLSVIVRCTGATYVQFSHTISPTHFPALATSLAPLRTKAVDSALSSTMQLWCN